MHLADMLPQYAPLVHLMALVLQREMNIRRDLLREILRTIERQGGNVEEIDRYVDEDPVLLAPRANARAERGVAEMQRAEAILTHPIVFESRAAQIWRAMQNPQRQLSPDDVLAWNAALVQHTFGDVQIADGECKEDPGERPAGAHVVAKAHAISLVPTFHGRGMNPLKQYRAISALLDPRHPDPLTKARHDLANSGHHSPAVPPTEPLEA